MSNLGLLPIALVITAASTFVVSYSIAVARHDVDAAFPYISDTGSERPESCIFGLFLNITSCLAFCTMYVRYLAVQAMAASAGVDRWLRRMNKGSLVLGIVSSIGCALVANFQEGTMVEAVHLTGAGMAFGVGVVYCFLQTALSYHMYPDFNGRMICRIRLTISCISLISLIGTVFAAAISFHEWNKQHHNNMRDKFKWSSDQPGYAAHVVSTVGEWVTAMTFLFFFFSYVREFNKFDVKVKAMPLVRHFDEFVADVGDIEEAKDFNERTRLLA